MECHNELVEAVGNNALPYHTVAQCVGKFHQEPVSTSDEQRLTGQCAVIEQIMDEDRQWMPLELERISGIEKCTLHRILCKELQLCKIASWWVPYVLMEVQRWVCYAICSDHLALWQQHGDQFS